MDCIRENGIIADNPFLDMKDSLFIAVPSANQSENTDQKYLFAYCFDTSKNTLKKVLKTEKKWFVNFNDMHGQYYSTLAPLLKICLEETDIKEKAQELCKLENALNELLERAMKLEYMDEVNKAITANYSRPFSEMLEQSQEVTDSYKELL